MALFPANKQAAAVVVAVVILAGWFGYAKWYLPARSGPQSHQVFGFLKSMNGNQLVVSGVHILDGQQLESDYNDHLADIAVTITPNTKLVKSVWHIPITQKALAANKGALDPKTIQKEQLSGTPDDFKDISGMSMTIKTRDNSLSKSTLEASEINYLVSVFAK